MIIENKTIKVEDFTEDNVLKILDKNILDKAIFFDLEHYLYKKPICVGVFGAGVYNKEKNEVNTTQYMIENREDSYQILHMAKKYFKEMKFKGKEYIVTFSGDNDFFVINYLFEKHFIEYNFEENFKLVDLQTEYEKKYQKNIGLKNLEKLCNIERKGHVMSGMTLAKTFSKVMRDNKYINRMPDEKKKRILNYNQQDVINLFHIMKDWEKIKLKDIVKMEEKREVEKLLRNENKRNLQEGNYKNQRNSFNAVFNN